jgi:KDO2-lipid IV(A) lauroyltransferase
VKKSILSTDALGTGLAIVLSQLLPNWLGYPVARFIGWLVSLFPNGSAYRALRLNQWIVSGKSMNERQLRRSVRRVFFNQGLALYDFYHALDRPDLIRKMAKFTPAFEKLIGECNSRESPTMIVFSHLSGFNMGGLRLAQELKHTFTLSYPNPSPAYLWQNKLRNDRGMEVAPFTIEALGEARRRLLQGGTILTGVDRPLDESHHHPLFFGYPTNLPVAYIQLALKTNARVFVAGFMTLADHTILIDVSDQIVLEHHPDSDRELEMNAEKVLKDSEDFIRKDPSHWMMFFPIWPKELSNLEKHSKEIV